MEGRKEETSNLRIRKEERKRSRVSKFGTKEERKEEISNLLIWKKEWKKFR